CGTCAADLALGAQIVSKGFTGRYGRAFLLDDGELLNIKIGSRENRQLVTGAHVVADISCAVCGTKVGWKYVQATEAAQKYKEGKFILE
ncbi:yippee-like protein, partial [Coniochaeta ligniaria NRRL 30616]